MKIAQAFALVLIVATSGCSGPGMVAQSATGPARSTGLPVDVNDRELETPNSLPPGFTTANPMAQESGVVGVTHLAP